MRAVQLFTESRCCSLRSTCTFPGIFPGWIMLLHPQATSTDHAGPQTSDLSIEKRRRNHFITAPMKCNSVWKCKNITKQGLTLDVPSCLWYLFCFWIIQKLNWFFRASKQASKNIIKKQPEYRYKNSLRF